MKIGIAIIVYLVLCLSAIYIFSRLYKSYENLKEETELLEEEQEKLNSKKADLEDEITNLQVDLVCSLQEKKSADANLVFCENRLSSLQKELEESISSQHRISQQAFEQWWEILQKDYESKEKEYDVLVEGLNKSYAEEQEKLIAETDEIRKELDTIRATRTAAIEAQRKEKEIKEKLSFYCLSVVQEDLDDIQKLERVKKELHNPRILSMLIWQTYWQKPMTRLCNDVLGTSVVCGIYKITNQISGECYVGQSLDLASRWKQHAKCALGIDTPPGNKLYKAMMTDGIWNFSWELLEACSKEELNTKEKFYINLYNSYNWGYNSNQGIGKGVL